MNKLNLLQNVQHKYNQQNCSDLFLINGPIRINSIKINVNTRPNFPILKENKEAKKKTTPEIFFMVIPVCASVRILHVSI